MILILLWLIFVRIIKVLLFLAYSDKNYGKIPYGSIFFNVFELVQDSTVSYCCSTLVRTVCMTHIALQTFVWLLKTISVHTFITIFQPYEMPKTHHLGGNKCSQGPFLAPKMAKNQNRRHFQKFGYLHQKYGYPNCFWL